MWSWLKSIFPTPKKVIGEAIDALDLLVPVMANEIDRIRDKFNAMDSKEKSKWAVAVVKKWLRGKFKIE